MRRSIAFVIAAGAVFMAAALPALASSDPYRSRQWAIDRIRAEQAWSASQGAGVTIAIVDTGIDLTHPDLKGKIAASYTCVGGTCSAGGDDDNGHGSHVAGIAAAATRNGIGIAGIAPAAKLMAVKTLAADGSGACSDVELGIRWAADHGARVVNLSLGPEILKGNPLGVLCTSGLQQAAAYAWDKGAVVVVAAGNDHLVSLYSSDNLLVVGATGPDDTRPSYSNRGANIYAPGGDPGSSSCSSSTCVPSTWKDGGYASADGTSMAAPHVSGVAALVLARGYTNSQVLSRIRSTADNVGGILRVNAARAVGAAVAPSTPKPKPTGAGPGSTTGSSSGTGSQNGTPSAGGATSSASPGVPGSGTASPASTGSAQDHGSNRPQASRATSERGSSGKSFLMALAALAALFVCLIAARFGIRRFRGGG